MIKTYMPKLEVGLIKTAMRSEVAPGRSAAPRYQSFTSLDLTDYLIAGEPVSTRHQLGNQPGTWNLTLADRPVNDHGESLYYLIEANDLIEIRMARSPHEYAGGRPPVVMRGFVSSVDRSRANFGGTVHRRVHVAGADFSKVLDIIRIYYLNNSAIGDNIMGELRFFQKYASESDAKIMSAKEFAELVLAKVVNPFIARLTRDAKGQEAGEAVLDQLVPEISIEGTVSPLSVSLFNDGSVRQFLSEFLDVGVFNELFVDDRENETALVIRPNRFLTLDGQPIQGPAMTDEEFVTIPDRDIESITEGRTDQGVANYYWVNNHGWQIRDTIEVSQLAASGDVKQYALVDYINSSATRFGFRKMEVSSALGAPDQNYGDSMKAAQSRAETDRLITWLTERRRILAEQNKDNAILEEGTMTVGGNERVRRGMYVAAMFGEMVPALYYVTGVAHQMIPNGTFKTMITFERSTGFAGRATTDDGSYHAERNMKGLL